MSEASSGGFGSGQWRAALERFEPPLRVVAEDLLGEEDARIDLLAATPEGQTVVVLVSRDERCGLGLVAEGLVQRTWVAARLSDWLKLAPELGLRPELTPQVLLIAPDFSRRARLAAREADRSGIRLARLVASQSAADPRPRLEPVALPQPPQRVACRELPASTSPFRTGLRDEDLSLSPEERATLLGDD